MLRVTLEVGEPTLLIRDNYVLICEKVYSEIFLSSSSVFDSTSLRMRIAATSGFIT